MKLLIYAILAYLFYRLIKGAFRSKKQADSAANGEVIDEMVQDPFCKTYIPRRGSVRKVIDGHERFFCSSECASRFLLESKDQHSKH